MIEEVKCECGRSYLPSQGCLCKQVNPLYKLIHEAVEGDSRKLTNLMDSIDRLEELRKKQTELMDDMRKAVLYKELKKLKNEGDRYVAINFMAKRWNYTNKKWMDLFVYLVVTGHSPWIPGEPRHKFHRDTVSFIKQLIFDGKTFPESLWKDTMWKTKIKRYNKEVENAQV